MRRRSTRKKTSAGGVLESPFPETAETPASPNRSASESPKEFEFNFYTTTLPSSVSIKKKSSGGASASMLMQPTGGSSPPSLKSMNTVSDLKEFASSRMESMKRQLERSHSEIFKDIEASQSRLHKRFKIQTQACQQLMDQVEMEHKKMLDQITESREAMKALYTEFMVEAQAGASRLCKTSIPDISKSFEKAVSSLRSRYGISTT